MKKIEKIILLESKLTFEELKYLKGGDIINENKIPGCECTYENPPTPVNINRESGCSCWCY
jgi:hypothetical protein